MTLAEFVQACGQEGITQVVMRRTAEVQPVTDEEGTRLDAVQRVVLLAYADGRILRFVREGTGIECMPALSEAGLSVTLKEDHKFRIERS